MQLYWHRRNLLPHPNRGLEAAFGAANRDESCVVPIFVLDDAILSRASGLGVAFMLSSLRSLRAWYRDHGSDLVIQRGDPATIVSGIADRLAADRVVWNSDYSKLARGRDQAVKRALGRSDIDYSSVADGQSTGIQLPHTPIAELAVHLASPPVFNNVENTVVPRLSELDKHSYDSAPLTAGTKAARKRLNALAEGRTYRRCDEIRSFWAQQSIASNMG